MSYWRLFALLLAGGAYALLAHWAMLHHPTAPWALVLLLGPLCLSGVALAWRRWGAGGGVLAVLGSVCGVVLVLRSEAGDPNRLYLFQHVAINLLLGLWFGVSLRPGCRPLIGIFAQRLHAMTSAMWIYCGQVTKVWTAYFVAMALVSVGVYHWLPFSAWALLANVLTPISVGTLLVGEYVVRYRLHPEFERVRLTDVWRAWSAASPTDGSLSR